MLLRHHVSQLRLAHHEVKIVLIWDLTWAQNGLDKYRYTHGNLYSLMFLCGWVSRRLPGTLSLNIAAEVTQGLCTWRHTLLSYTPVMFCQKSFFCVIIRVEICLLDDSVCSLFRLSLVTGLQCAVWVSGCVTADCNGWTLQGGKNPAACLHLKLFSAKKIQPGKIIIWGINCDKTRLNRCARKSLTPGVATLTWHYSSILWQSNNKTFSADKLSQS